MITGVRLLAWRMLRNNRKRTCIISAAVILTAVLFTTVVSIAYRINQAEQVSKQLYSGSDFHGKIDGLTHQEADCIVKHKLVKEAYQVKDNAYIRYGGSTENLDSQQLFVCQDASILTHMFIKIVDGRYPKEPNEILLEKGYMNRLGIPDTIGSTLTFHIQENGKNHEETFILSGYYESRAEALCEKPVFISQTSKDKTSLYIMINNAINIEGKLKRILHDIGLKESNGVTYEENNAYSFAREEIFDLQAIAAFIFIILVIFLCGFLLIYNVYEIALTRDIRFYGLLKTLGTTGKQLIDLIFYQVNCIYIVSMPIGLLLGYLIGWKILSPLFMSLEGAKNICKFDYMILLFAIASTYVTIMISAVTPARKIKRMTCIEGMKKGQTVATKGRQKYSELGGKLYRMALSNLLRTPKKTIVMIASISLSVVLFLIVYTTVNVLSEKQEFQDADFCIQNEIEREPNKVEVPQIGYWYTEYLLTKGNVEEIRQVDGVATVFAIVTASVMTDTKGLEMKRVDKAEQDERESRNFRENTQEKKETQVHFYGIPEEALPYLKNGFYKNNINKNGVCKNGFYKKGTAELSGSFDAEYFMSGKGCLAGCFVMPKEKGVFSCYLPKDRVALNTLRNQYDVIALVKPGRKILKSLMAEHAYPLVSLDIYLPYRQFVEEFTNYDIQAINVFIKKDADYDEVKARLRKTLGPNVVISDKKEQLSEFENRMRAIQMVGYSLSLMVFFIGILNYINTTVCAIYERRLELALFRVIGMTGKQMKRMLFYESALTLLAIIVFSLAIGSPFLEFYLHKMLESSMAVDWKTFMGMIGLFAIVVMITVAYTYHALGRLTPMEQIHSSE